MLLALCLLSPQSLRLHGHCWTPLAKVLPRVDAGNPGKHFAVWKWMSIVWQRWGMALRMSQSSQASPLTCSSLVTRGKVRDPSVEQWLGFGAEPILPSSLPGSQVSAGNGRSRSSWTPSGAVAVLKFSGANLLLLSPLLLLLPKCHPLGLWQVQTHPEDHETPFPSLSLFPLHGETLVPFFQLELPHPLCSTRSVL